MTVNNTHTHTLTQLELRPPARHIFSIISPAALTNSRNYVMVNTHTPKMFGNFMATPVASPKP